MLASGNLGTTSTSGYYLADVASLALTPGYYTVHVYVNRGSSAYGTSAKTYADLSFLKSSAGVTSVGAAAATY